MIAKVYVIACDKCKTTIQVLDRVQSVGSAFKAAKKLPWDRNNDNTKHACPECMAFNSNNKKASNSNDD